MKRTFLSLLLIALFMCGKVLAQPAVNGLPEGFSVLPGYPFVIVADFGQEDELQLSDSLFNALAVGVQFKVNRTEINPESPFLSTYRNQVLPLLRSNSYKLRKLFMRAAASPEGPYDNNYRLGIGRASALCDVICDGLQQAYSDHDLLKTDRQTITEDYGYLIDLMREANDPDYEVVRDIFETAKHDERATKAALMKARGGELWDRLYRQYFDRLRTARIVLVVGRILPKLTVSAPALEPFDASILPPRPITLSVDTMPEKPIYARRHLIALRTNMLLDAFYMPQFGWAPSLNAQLEYYPLDGHYTYNAGFTWSNHRHWGDQQFFQVRDLQLELRRYFVGGGKFLGPYLGAYLQGNVYGIGLSKTKGWQGEGGGAGISAGYVLPISRKGHWRLEFMAAVGGYFSLYDPYVYGNPITWQEDGDYYYNYLGSASAFKKRNHRYTWFGPTNLGIQITYDIIYRKRHLVQKGGAQ